MRVLLGSCRDYCGAAGRGQRAAHLELRVRVVADDEMRGHLRQSTGGAGASCGCVSAPPPSLYITGNLKVHLAPGPQPSPLGSDAPPFFSSSPDGKSQLVAAIAAVGVAAGNADLLAKELPSISGGTLRRGPKPHVPRGDTERHRLRDQAGVGPYAPSRASIPDRRRLQRLAVRVGEVVQYLRTANVAVVQVPSDSRVGCRADSVRFDATPDGVSPDPGALKATAYAFGNASNHRSTSTRRQPTARDPRPPSLTGAGKSPARTRRHNDVRDRPISARTADVLKIAGEESRTDLDAPSKMDCSATRTPG